MNAPVALRQAHHALYGRGGAYIPANFRERVAAIAPGYYLRHVQKLGKPNSDGWASCRCPFHEDKTPSCSVNLVTGAFCCHACNERGDLIYFHQKRSGLPFKQGVRALLGLTP